MQEKTFLRKSLRHACICQLIKELEKLQRTVGIDALEIGSQMPQRLQHFQINVDHCTMHSLATLLSENR